MIAGLCLGIVSLLIILGSIHHSAQAKPAPVIFRLDDVQDFYASNGTKAVMDLFLTKKIPLTTAIIAGHIGNDTAVVRMTNQGIKSGLFEAALHGLEHVDYTKLTPTMQSVTITKGNMILKQLFGIHPFVFVPPYDDYNNATLDAVLTHDMSIISSDSGTESRIKMADIFNGSVPCGTTDSGITCQPLPVHVSAGNAFRFITGGKITQLTNAEILTELANNVQKYGYGLLVLHPQDFVFTDPHTGKILHNELDNARFTQLTTLIDKIKTQYTPVSMEDLVSTMRPGV